MYSLESPHRGDFDEHTQYKKFLRSVPRYLSLGYIRNKGFKKEFVTAIVNEPSVFEPLKFECIAELHKIGLRISSTFVRVNSNG